jgi:hypothetical protein
MVVFIFEEQIAAAIEAHTPQKELTADCADSTASATCNAQLQPSRTRSQPIAAKPNRAERTHRPDTE